MSSGPLPPAEQPSARRQPRHIARLLLEVEADGRGHRELLEAALLLGEAILKTITGILYSAIIDADGARAGQLRAGLGTAGTWVTRLRQLLSDRAVASLPALVQPLPTWLTDRDADWVRRLIDKLAPALIVLRATYVAPQHPTVTDALDALVQLRNRRVHGGLISDAQLDMAAPIVRDAVVEVANQWPGADWAWGISDGHAWHMVTDTDDSPSILGGVTLPPPAPGGGLYIWAEAGDPLRCRDLLRGELDPPRILCLNSAARQNGRVEYLDYSTGEPVSERLEPAKAVGALPGTLPWLDEHVEVPLVIVRGREAAVEAVELDIRRHHRLITIVAPSGMGKTTVASEVARHSEPARRARLAHCEQWPSDQEQFEEQVLRPLGDRVATGQVLLILDSLESALDEARSDTVRKGVQALLGQHPDLVILCTSLRPLELPGERQHPLPPLEGPPAGEEVPLDDITAYPAAQQLVDRIRDTDVHYRLTGAEAPAIQTILHWVGGHPLAAQLVAPRVALRGAVQVASELATMMTDARRPHGPGRHRSVEAAMAYSLEPLSDSERMIMLALAMPWFLVSRQMLQAQVGHSFEAGLAGVDAVLDDLQTRRLIVRQGHSAYSITHTLIGPWVRMHWGSDSRVTQLELAGLAHLEARAKSRLRGGGEPCCEVCGAMDNVASALTINHPLEFQPESVDAFLGFALAWARFLVDGDSPERLLVGEGAQLLDDLFDELTTGPLPASSGRALDARVQAALWWNMWMELLEHGEAAAWLVDDLVGAGRADEAVEIVFACFSEYPQRSAADLLVQMLESLARAGRVVDAVGLVDKYIGNAFADCHVTGSDLGVECAEPLLRWKIRWIHGQNAAVTLSDALLRHVRVLLHLDWSGAEGRRDALRVARREARRARVWCERTGNRAGAREAVVTEALTEFHLARAGGRWRQLLAQVGLGSDSQVGHWPTSDEEREAVAGDDRLGWSAYCMHLRGDAGERGRTALVEHAPKCATDAEESSDRQQWGEAARWVGICEACLGDAPADEAVRMKLERTHGYVEQHLGRGATTIAIAEYRTTSDDDLLRQVGFWVPGDPI